MSVTERLSNLGYLGLKKQTGPTTPATPNVFVPIYGAAIQTDLGLITQTPIYGGKFENYNVIPGSRSHKGTLTTMAEPNTTAHIANMLLTKVSTTGSGPYVHTFELTGNAQPYTADISTGNVVARFVGLQASKLTSSWNGGELQWVIDVMALMSFRGATLSGTPTGSGPYTVALDTTHDPAPTKCLVVGDLIRFVKESDGTVIDATIATIVDGVSITTSIDVTSLGSGDVMHLRPATVSFTLLDTFIWPKTQYCFGATATAALSASQTQVEQGSKYEITHKFENDTGSQRSGSFDPAALPRLTGLYAVSVNKVFDGPEDVVAGQKLTKTSLALRHYAGSTNQYEARLVANHLKTDGKVFPELKPGEIEYSQIDYPPVYDSGDGKGMQFVVTNNLASV